MTPLHPAAQGPEDPCDLISCQLMPTPLLVSQQTPLEEIVDSSWKIWPICPGTNFLFLVTFDSDTLPKLSKVF